MTNKINVGSTILNTGRLSILHYADQFIVAGSMVFLARYCDIVLLGQYLTLTAFWTWGAMLVDFGLNPVLIRESAQYGYNARVLVYAVLLKIFVLIFVFCLFFVWNYFIQRISMAAALFFPMVIGIRCLNSTLSALLAGRNRAVSAVKCQVLTRTCLVFFICIALILKQDIGYAVMFHIVIELFLSYLLWQETAFFKPVLPCPFNIRSMVNIFRESAVVGLTGSSLLLLLKQPLFWLERYAPSEAALYGIAVRLMEMLLIPVYALLVIIFPEIVKNRDNPKFRFSLKFGVLIAFMLIALISLSFVLPGLHFFKFIAAKLSPLDVSMPWWIFCTILLCIAQIISVYCFLKKKLYLVLFTSLGLNAVVFIYFFLLNFTGWKSLFRYESSIVVVNLSMILVIAGVWWGNIMSKKFSCPNTRHEADLDSHLDRSHNNI